MKYFDKIAEHLNVRITDRKLADCLDSCISSIDFSNPDEIVIQTFKKKSNVKIKDGKFSLYGEEKDEEFLRKFSGLLISFLGWDDTAFPIEQSKLISYCGRMPEYEATTNNQRKDNESKDQDVVFSIEATPSRQKQDFKINERNPKSAFSHSASTQQYQLQKRADVWKSRGMENVDIHDQSVWVTVKKNVVIEDCDKELKLHGNYDLQAITLMVSHAKETWNNKCRVNGDNEFKALVWRECYIQGVNLTNFQPEADERKRLIADIEQLQSSRSQAPLKSPEPVAA